MHKVFEYVELVGEALEKKADEAIMKAKKTGGLDKNDLEMLADKFEQLEYIIDGAIAYKKYVDRNGKEHDEGEALTFG